jgi:hypothetical protein
MDQQLVAGAGAWQKGIFKTTDRFAETSEHIAASGGWTAEDTYALKVVRYNTPFVTTYRLRFAGDQLVVDSEQNVGPGNQRVAAHLAGSLDKVASNE